MWAVNLSMIAVYLRVTESELQSGERLFRVGVEVTTVWHWRGGERERKELTIETTPKPHTDTLTPICGHRNGMPKAPIKVHGLPMSAR